MKRLVPFIWLPKSQLNLLLSPRQRESSSLLIPRPQPHLLVSSPPTTIPLPSTRRRQPLPPLPSMFGNSIHPLQMRCSVKFSRSLAPSKAFTFVAMQPVVTPWAMHTSIIRMWQMPNVLSKNSTILPSRAKLA